MSIENENNKKMKLCIKCNIEKDLHEGFYKAGSKSFQKYCKPCHNKSRLNWHLKSSYVKIGSGFQRLPEEIRQNILKDIEDNVKYAVIARKYDINYITLMSWRKKNLIL